MKKIADNHAVLNHVECNIMRGFAILAVASNNFGHLVNGVVQDNEFVYDYGQVDAFVSSLRYPSNTFWLDLLSFYSPFGVMLFIFLSGYGLTRKYEKGQGVSVSNKNFILGHYLKLFQMQLKGLTLFLLIMFLFDPDYIVYFRHLVSQLLMIENMNPIDPIIIAGPYWFFGMIVEMYVIYRFVLYQKSSSFILSVVIISLLFMIPLDPVGAAIRYLRINFCMAMLPFCLGILVARYTNVIDSLFDNGKKCLISIMIFFLLLTICKFTFYSWIVMPIFIIGLSIPLSKIICRFKYLSAALSWVGALSGVIFVVHPIMREILIQRTNQSGNYYGMFFAYLFMTIMLSIVLKPLFLKKK